MINFIVQDRDGQQMPVSIPEGINLNLMEVLKASEYDILATCGGMALCATCHVQVVEGPEQYFTPTDNELDMLDTLPNAGPDSRLACQIHLSEEMDGMVFRLL